MKVVILGDCHLGARSGSSHFAKFFNRFFDNQLYPYMLEHGITQIFQLGDLFDQRQQLNLKAYHQCKPSWFDPLEEYGFTMHVLLGNHDITLRESLSINTPESLLQQYIRSGAIKVYKEPTKVDVDKNVSFDIIPWICSENKEEIEKFISRKSIADFCLGHFEIAGAAMYRGIEGHGGIPTSTFERYEGVLSGHYHTRSHLQIGDTGKMIQYVGTPYELTWMDSHDPRGFTILDTETRTFEFIPNTETMFNKIYYRGTTPLVNSSEKDISGKFIKLYVESKGDLFEFDSFINTVRTYSPYDLSIVENNDSLMGGEAGDDSIDIEDTLTIISNYIDSLQTDIDKSKVKEYINSLYIEAITR